ncbi:MAG: SDR family oxidoreductase [Helicobacter bilis]|uniref:SDR family NAD(P)-dependent oxidoreductase n=1 Tax=Helicobacter bilis TaxID=37372 RepID=UPI0026E9655D|nr:SDR family oxidoreductase [Helicobacter bilis]MCI7411078.1 SDR family oxidoreductase [Helicobacter bilis]MDD7297029.1 SDR family NAD(P)-dependent oxidoreductase [Helicobacter bilis]MDY4400913.1 SDR family oxidoreductase [Helicobacter bilis]
MPRVILITGTRKGIGRDLSEYYLNKGDIVCGCSRTQSNLEHKNYRHFTLDVSDENAVVNMVRAVKKEFGTIDVLLNNAGIASMNHILTTPLKTMQNIFNTNVFGSFLFLREVSKVMVQNYKKRIKDLESKGLDSKNNAKNAIAEAVCDDFKESAILDSNNKDSSAEGILSDFSGFTKESIAFGAKGEGSLLNINDRSLSEQSAKSTTCAKHQSKPAKKPTQTTQMPYRIVNFATVTTPLRLEGEAAYAASKAALVNLTQVCAKELSEFGITINAVGPTPVPTDLIKNVPKAKMDALLNQQAIKRFGEFRDVLNAIEFFLDEKSDFITAQVIYLGGVNA